MTNGADELALGEARNQLMEFVDVTWKKFLERYPDRGVSFQITGLDELYRGLSKEIQELANLLPLSDEISTSESRRGELLDIANYCWMIWTVEMLVTSQGGGPDARPD